MALGDSFAAGLGNNPDTWIPGTVDGGYRCRRSYDAWPELLAQTLRDDRGADYPFEFLACSGAVVGDLNGTNPSSDQNQLAASSLLSAATEFVTVSIGGNDLGFGATFKECIKGREVPPSDPSDPLCNSPGGATLEQCRSSKDNDCSNEVWA